MWDGFGGMHCIAIRRKRKSSNGNGIEFQEQKRLEKNVGKSFFV